MSRKHKKGRPLHPDVLTPAEWRVADAVRHGMSNPAIAKRLGVSLDAIKFHMSNTLTKLGFSRRSELRQWDGVSVDSQLHSTPKLERAVLTMGTIGQISRSVADIDAAVRWYRDTFGLSHLFSFPSMAFFDCDGTRLMLVQGGGAANSILYFRVEDIRVAHRILLERGAISVAAPHMIHRHSDGTEEWMAFFNDNEGRPLAIMAQVSPTNTMGEISNDS
jgi:DNA-binding CsgD family transcriptional regulator/catechol 2,3-dioxygenase-like lactoylglutathione lyase family enzyme